MDSSDQTKKWQASIFATKGSEQETVFYGATLHALRQSAHEWLLEHRPEWFSNVSPLERLNVARTLQRATIEPTEPMQSRRGQSGEHRYSSTPPRLFTKEPEITAEMAQRYPLIFSASQTSPADGQPGVLVEKETEEAPATSWHRSQGEQGISGAIFSNEQSTFQRFENAVQFFLLADLLPECGPNFQPEAFASDVAFYTRVKTFHREGNEVLINDYLSRGWLYNGLSNSVVTSPRNSGNSQVIVTLYHLEAHAR
jgi:hypothetical protein